MGRFYHLCMHIELLLGRYLDSAEVLLRETGSASLAKYQVCDNIDLPTILQVLDTPYIPY